MICISVAALLIAFSELLVPATDTTHTATYTVTHNVTQDVLAVYACVHIGLKLLKPTDIIVPVCGYTGYA